METVRIPRPRTPRFVMAVAQARAAAIRDGIVGLAGVKHSEAYLTYVPPDQWAIEPANLFEPPLWTEEVLSTIRRHGATA